ncbi:MAG: Hpt domain-containing protein [Sulfurimonas sp.]|nr:Hpt domain-containing protein [Sulfurimonas sp.]
MNATINLQAIADELEFDLEDIEMLLEVFIESAYENLVKLEIAIKADDFEAIVQSAHAIKGSASNILLDEVTTIANKMEIDAKDKDELSCKDLYEKLKISIDSLKN